MGMFDAETNRRIIAGNFPDMELYPAEINDDDIYVDIEQLAEDGFKAIKECPELFSLLFMELRNRCKEINSSRRPFLYDPEANILINTGIQPNSISPLLKSRKEAAYLIPAVTEIDKILWLGVSSFYAHQQFDDDFSEGQRNMLYVFLYLLLHTEEKEQEYGKTIHVDKFIKAGAHVEDILSSWDNPRKYKHLFSGMLLLEMKSLSAISEKRNAIFKELRTELIQEKEIAQNSEHEWNIFIHVLNDLASKERATIDAIFRATSRKEKTIAINQFKICLNEIKQWTYCLDGEDIQLIPIHNAVLNRFQKAPCLSTVYTERERPFILTDLAFKLVFDPVTYNYLRISFHQFRLNQNETTAKEFLITALKVIKNNLGNTTESDWASISDIVEDFYSTVMTFYRQNEEVINRLSFNKIRSDSAVVYASLSGADSQDLYKEDLSKRIHSFENSPEYNKILQDIINHKAKPRPAAQVQNLLADEGKRIEQKKQEAKAAPLIQSLNIIYMFCEGLRIILGNKKICAKIRDTEKVAGYRNELSLLDGKLVYKVYENLDEQEIRMLEYRERNGLTAWALSEQEAQEERLRNEECSAALAEAIEELISLLDKEDVGINRINEAKKRIREKFLLIPECDAKDQYAERFDSVAHKISNYLVSKYKAHDDYEIIKGSILRDLGQNAAILPETALDSLTTAEMLYRRFASSDFEVIGFDFSCISALYYQAFEEAYNVLIWKKYSDFLNELVINGKAYTDILENNRGVNITDPNATGYLDNDPKQRDYYVEYKSKSKQRFKTMVSSGCMYKSFSNLLGEVSPNGKLDKFCDFFAELTGFENKTVMFNDVSFMEKVLIFKQKVKNSADNRNNASHGGPYISLEQCDLDKKTVLYEKNGPRNDSLGLIQLLLSIVKAGSIK